LPGQTGGVHRSRDRSIRRQTACPFADCVADGELEAASDALAEELRGFPPLAQRSAKKLMNDIEDAGLSLAIELEGQCYGRLRSSDDFREGVEAFHRPLRGRGARHMPVDIARP
jgi:enoyl-CoA hydratase/carnithine racemase